MLTSLIGQGYYGTVTPPVIQRNILENPAWYTAYTPYQPEISQGRLEALLNFQTMVCDLTGLDVANASLLDEATAAAEAMALCQRAATSKAEAFFVDRDCHPQTIDVIRTRAEPYGWEVVVGDPFVDLDAGAVFGAIFQYPGTHGDCRDFSGPIKALHGAGALACVAADPLALTLLVPPGEMGADIAVGSTQRFGVPLGFGGPHAAYMAVKDPLKRSMPGRIVGVSIDARGNRAYRLSLQTREQHIRREKATSNVCTAQALLAVMASMYAVFHGPEGLRAIAQRIHRKTVRLAKGLETLGFRVEPAGFFDTITVEVGALQGVILKAAVAEGINLRKVGSDRIGISLDERTRREHTQAVWRAFGGDMLDRDLDHEYRLPENLIRTSDYLTHPIFHMNRAEAEITRYMRRLADRDLALDRAMIPLGSCTMKLNATAEMMALSWPEFADIHPFAPSDQTEGYQEVIGDLCAKLCDITGYDAFSMQPNSGAQGEYAGLLTIRAYHASRGRGASRRVPDPDLGARDEPGERADGGHEGGGGGVGGERGRGPRRLPDEGRAARRQPCGLHGDLSLDARGFRGNGARSLPDHAPARRAGLPRRREHERAGGAGAAGGLRVGRQPSEFAQDFLHPAWRRRAGDGADRGEGASGAVPAGAAGGRGAGERRRLRVAVAADDLVGVLPDDGRGRTDAGDEDRDPECELHRGAAEGGVSDPLMRGTDGWRTSASSTCGC